MADAAVTIRGLTKQDGRVVAVKNLDLEVSPGEIVEFLGLNGAGKTTTIRILLDLLRPWFSAATARRKASRSAATVGYLPGEMGLYADLTGREVLDLLARLAGTRIDPAWRRTLQERFEIPESDLRRRLMQQGFYEAAR